MSDYVVHFAKSDHGRSAYANMMGILSSQTIQAPNRFGIARNIAPGLDTQRVACFSETPLHYLKRIAERRSQFGIVFQKNFIVSRGGNPILYTYQNQPLAKAIQAIMGDEADNPGAPIWSITPFIDTVGGSYNFEWEREWRHVGDFHFTSSDVAFLILPATSHEAARQFFTSAEEDDIGPNYPCALIDASWNQQQIASALDRPL